MKVENSITIRTKTGCSSLYVVFITNKDKKIRKIFIKKGKSGMCFASQLEALQNVMNIAIKLGADVEKIAKSLLNIRCPNAIYYEGKQILSCADAVGQVMLEFLENEKNK